MNKNDLFVFISGMITLVFIYFIMIVDAKLNSAMGDTLVPDSLPTEQLIMVHDTETDEIVEVPFYDVSVEVPLYTPDTLECMALNIYHEARGDNYAGKVAVSDVVLNRVNDTRYPNTICDVIYQGGEERGRCHFSWYCDGRSDIPFDDIAWQEAEMIAKEVLENQQGITEGATHYHAYTIRPDWVNDRGMQMVGRIGDHVFYRWN